MRFQPGFLGYAGADALVGFVSGGSRHAGERRTVQRLLGNWGAGERLHAGGRVRAVPARPPACLLHGRGLREGVVQCWLTCVAVPQER